MDLIDPATEDANPGWRPVLRALRAGTGRPVEAAWTTDGRLEVTTLTSDTDVAAVHRVVTRVLERTCDECGRLGRPVPVDGGWCVRCGEHDPAAPSFTELWEALNQDHWFRDFEVGMVRVEEMTPTQRQAAIDELRRDPLGLADKAQWHALFRAARRRDREAFDEALLIPADDEAEARRMVEESPLMRALRRQDVDQATEEVIYRWGDVLDRLATDEEDEDE